MAGSRATGVWVVQTTDNPRFPFRITIQGLPKHAGDEAPVLVLWTQDKWPGGGRQIFCIREDALADATAPPALTEIERVPIVHLERFGRQLSIILDRAQRKRCSFLFLRKRYQNQAGSYEQIFFRTQQALRGHRSASRVQLRAHGAYQVVIDSAERYPWKFGGVPTERRRLAAGDYALQIEDELVALVERKSFENLLSDFGSIKILHGALKDLSRTAHAACVIEAQYADFLNERKLEGRWPATHCARVLSELAAMHPAVQFIFAGSRKAAEQWCAAYFAARAKLAWHQRAEQREPLWAGDHEPTTADAVEAGAMLVAESAPTRPARGAHLHSSADAGQEVRAFILRHTEGPLSIAQLRAAFPAVPDGRIRTVLFALRREGRVERRGAGPSARWHALSQG